MAKKKVKNDNKTAKNVVNNAQTTTESAEDRARRLFLYKSAEIQTIIKTQKLNKKKKTSFMDDTERFIMQFLTMQGFVAPLIAGLGFLSVINPLFGLVGIIGLGVSIPVGLGFAAYATHKDRKQRNHEEEQRMSAINGLKDKSTLIEHINSTEFTAFLKNILALGDANIDKINDRLFDNALLKDKVLLLKGAGTVDEKIERVKNAIINNYVRSQDEKQTSPHADKTYSKHIRYAISGFGLATTFPAFNGIVTGIVFASLALAGVAVGATLIGGVTFLGMLAALTVGAVVGGVFYYCKKKRDERDGQHSDMVKKLENQQEIVSSLTIEAKGINRHMAEIKQAAVVQKPLVEHVYIHKPLFRPTTCATAARAKRATFNYGQDIPFGRACEAS